MRLDELLSAMRGAAREGWWPSSSPFEVMVGAMLVQQTTWEKAHAASLSLAARGLMMPETLSSAGAGVVEDIVRPCGFYRQKARRVRGMARFVAEAGGTDALDAIATEELEAMLLGLEGVGRETADAMLAFAFMRPRFVAAAYVLRVLRRTGVMPSAIYGTAQAAVHALRGADAAALRSDYAAFVEIAREHCRSRPRCDGCPLRPRCLAVSERRRR
jgi:endonuclease-3 related protein